MKQATDFEKYSWNKLYWQLPDGLLGFQNHRPDSISWKNVLHMGPDYENHRGGIAAVLDVYRKNISPFKFIPTYSNRPWWYRQCIFLRAILLLFFTLVADKSIQVAHIHSSSRGSFIRKSLLLLICKLFRKKTIIHIHASEFHLFYQNAKILRGYIRFILGKTDTVVCLSSKWKDFFTSNFKIKELVIVNNVIEYVAQKNKAIERDNIINLLFLGRIGDRKGIFDLLEVLRKNREAFKGKYKLVVGGNGEVERFKQTVADYQLCDEIEYAGWVNGAKKASLLNKCDIYILPSYNEGLPISVLEAMAYGKPVISTTAGGIPEIILPGYNGWLFEPGDRQALQSILREAMEDRPAWKEYGTNSLNMSRNYTPGVVLESLDTLYKKLLHA